MPELPEVETIVRFLKSGGEAIPAVPGQTIESVQVTWARTLAQSSADVFQREMAGKTIRDIARRGKFLVFDIPPKTMLVHLRMSGDLRVEVDEVTLQARPHDRIIWSFRSGYRLVFNDARKFGRVWLVDDPSSVLGALGPEPFSPELTSEVFHQKLTRRKKTLKTLLMDQGFMAGLGNIYTDEALFLSGLHPRINSAEVSLEKAGLLLKAIRQVLEEGILHHGASIDWVYRGGDFQNTFCVYQRTGEPCRNCGTPIERCVLGQRGTHFCPVCQPGVEVK